MRTHQKLAIVVALTLLFVVPVSGQSGRSWDPTGLQLTREELKERLTIFEETSNSDAYSGTIRDRARAEAMLIRQRLEEGDIRIGDQIKLTVEGQTTLTNDFAVVTGRKIVLPDLGDVPLSGVLRSELQTHLRDHIAKFIINPVVYAQSSIRLEIVGAVGRPGFYMVPSDMVFTDVLMLAGGPAANAGLDRMKIKRGKTVIWDGDRLREALVEGRTLDQLSMRAGDGIEVPLQKSKFTAFRSVMVGLSSLASIAFLLRRTGVL